MIKRKLGGSGLEIAPLVFGGNVFGWTADEPASHAILDAFVDAGFDCIDTADTYSRWAPGNKGGESETILGNWMKRRGGRDKLIIATKLGGEMGPGLKGLSSKYMVQAVESSLRRLQTDYIDLYQAHWDDLGTPIDDTLQGFAKLIQSGKVRAFGASNFEPVRIKESLAISKRLGLPRYEVLQPQYNLYDRSGYEAEREALCVREGLGVIPYYALASGFLTGKYRSEKDLPQSPRGERKVKEYLNPRGMRILAALDAVAARHNTKPAQVALAWLLARPSITAPIVSATSLPQTRDLIDATRLKLDAASLAELDLSSAP